jgi:radical SAM superfamily enzyme YgiQ (UPF0313 family)
MKLLLINPKFPESFWSFSWALKNVTVEKRTVNSPLGLATLAALTPSDWEIEIIDENIESIDWSTKADIVGVCGMGVQVERQKEILSHFKQQGTFVVAGGSYASLCPEAYQGLADSVIAGESEYIWPQFCRDYLAGKAQALYQETGNVSMHDSPCPRFDLLKLDRYQRISLQFSRGCPFQCEFCDIIIMFGRTPRNKSTAQIEKELDCLRQHGVTQVFFVDDNFIGNRKLAKDLLSALADYQERHQYRFSFGTEASVNLADDDALLSLLKLANFEWVFMGIESPSEESLKETKKFQNTKGSLIDKIQKIYASGLDIMAGFIVGFDSDDKTIFERQYQFIQASGIMVSMVGLLNALPKTPLYTRLEAAHRLKQIEQMDNTRAFTNIIPAQMTEEELVAGYIGLHQRLLQEKSIYQRIANKIRYLTHPSQSTDLKLKTKLIYLNRFLFKGILLGGPRRVYYFLRSILLGVKNPQVLPLIVADWIAAVSLQSFAKRYYDKPVTLGEWAERHFQTSLVQKVYRKIHKEILFRISEWQGTEKIQIAVQGSVGRWEVKVLSSSIKRYLQRCQGSIDLDFRGIKESGLANLRLLLTRLENYGNQVHLYLTEGVYLKFREELSAFQYTLVPVSP